MKKILISLFMLLALLVCIGCSDAEQKPDNNDGNVNDPVSEVEEYTLVLLPDYQANAKVTSLGGATVKSLTILAEGDGTVEIGVYGKVESIPYYTVSSAVHMRDGKEYTVAAGENKLDVNLDLDEYETIYISGNVKLAYSADGMAFSALGNVSDDVVISDEKLSLSADVEYHGEARVFEGDFNEMTGFNIGYKTNAVDKSNAPYVYQNAGAFGDKKITTIRIPVKNVATTDSIHSFTVYKVKNTVTSGFLDNYVSKYTIDIEFPRLSSNLINYWYDVDVSSFNIVLAEDETLAFGSPDDTVSFSATRTESLPEFKFISNAGDTPRGCLLFDVYYQTVIDKNEKLEQIKALDDECARDVALSKVIGGKYLSVLGDSVSVYNGFSNGDGADITNDTIRDNNGEYNGETHRVFSIDLTWWQKTANDTGMTVLVNNSSSGDHIYNGGQTRCEQLHDNTGDNAGTNPDIIALFLGFNDINWASKTPDELRTGYETMLNKVINKYPDADIFMFTYYQYDFRGKVGTEEFLEPYVNVVRELAEQYDCAVVDLFEKSGFCYDNYVAFSDDGIHPNPEGMVVVAEVFKDALYEKYCTNN